MPHRIVSMSLSREMAREMDALQKELGFSGRSELLRAGLRKMIAESREMERLAGERECILLVVHDKQAESEVIQAKHEFDDIIATQIHNNLRGGKCLELFLLAGPAERIQAMHNELQKNRKIGYVKLIVT